MQSIPKGTVCLRLGSYWAAYAWSVTKYLQNISVVIVLLLALLNLHLILPPFQNRCRVLIVGVVTSLNRIFNNVLAGCRYSWLGTEALLNVNLFAQFTYHLILNKYTNEPPCCIIDRWFDSLNCFEKLGCGIRAFSIGLQSYHTLNQQGSGRLPNNYFLDGLY